MSILLRSLSICLTFMQIHRSCAESVPFRNDEIQSFTLRHIFHQETATADLPLLSREIPSNTELWIDTEDGARDRLQALQIRKRNLNMHRMIDRSPARIESILQTARLGLESHSQAWTIESVPSPNVTDRDTIINFALMSKDAYTMVPDTGDWQDLDGRFGLNSTLDFGWESNGLRGHVFADTSNSTVVIAIKGTSRALYDGQGTTTSDKENDNLFFSCCCAQQGQWTWRQVCDCATSTYGCNQTCLVQNLREDHRYYQASRYLYSNVTKLYPDAEIWLTGHSLGGAVSSLLGLTFNLPTVTFEAPPDALAASRLGIPKPPNSTTHAHALSGVYHFGHTADPLFMGTCGTASSSCTWYGYAFQSQCHAGNTCSYDTVGDLGWRVGVWTHGINEVIKDVLKKYDHLPACFVDDECVDCYNWNFYESNSSSSTTSRPATSSTRSRTRTATCQTRGWWSCLDKTTTSTQYTSTSTVTTTCKTPGWFSCKDKTIDTTTSSGMMASFFQATMTPTATVDAKPFSAFTPQVTVSPEYEDEL